VRKRKKIRRQEVKKIRRQEGRKSGSQQSGVRSQK